MFSFDSQEQSAIAQTGFFVSLTSYGVFWLLDVMHPGFVARFFSVHLFLLGVIMFGIWWGAVVEEYTDRPFLQHLTMMGCGVLLAVLTWNLGMVFGSSRLVVSGVVLIVPVLMLRFVKYK